VLETGSALGDGSGLGDGVASTGADADGEADGGAGVAALGTAVGLAVGTGVGAGRHDDTPLPDAAGATGGGAASATSGIVPTGGNSFATSARMPATSGSWIDPRTSKPGRTSG
jgi:hypothetical protein